MTIAEAIIYADRSYPNSYTDEVKTFWLKKFDEKVRKELFSLYEETSPASLSVESDFDGDETLLIESPYDVIYIYELEAKMAYHDRDNEAYKSADNFLKILYGSYEKYYHRKHSPKGGKRFLF